MPGPPPTPTNVLKHRGSWRGKTRQGEPTVKLAKPRAPGYLSPEAKREWTRVVRELAEMKVLAKSDRDIVAAYCQAVADISRYTRFLAKEGETFETEKGYIMRRPETSFLRESIERMIKLSKHLGLSPAYRSKVQVLGDDEKPKEQGKKRFFG